MRAALAFFLLALLLAAVSAYGDAAFTLGEVVVTGAGDPAQEVSSIEEITADAIRAAGARTLADALRLARGARVDTAPTSLSANGKGESLLSLRGFDPRDVVVLIDGVPVYEPYFRVLDLRQIPVADVAKIQVIKGPAPVLYGPNGLGGVVNVVTRKGAGDLSGRVQASYGDVDEYAAEAVVRGAHRGVEYFLAPAYAAARGFRVSDDFGKARNEDGGVRNNSDFTRLQASGKVGYAADSGSVSLSASHVGFSGGVPFSMEAVDPGTLWRETWEKTGIALHGEARPVPLFGVRGNVFYTRLRSTIATHEDASMSSIADDGRAVSTYDNDVAGGAVFPEFRFGKAGTLTFAGLLKFDRADLQDEAGGAWTTTAAETYSAAAQYAARASIVDLAAGVAEHFYRRTKTPGTTLGDDNAATDAQLGVAVRPWPFLQVRAAAARKSAFPDLKALYGSEGNPGLRPEVAWNVDAGVRADPVREVGVEATFFYADVTDLIGKRDTGNTFTYENVDSATLWGVESALRLAFWHDRVTASAGYTFLRTRDGRPGRTLRGLDFRPEHTVSLAAEVAFPFGTRLAAQYLYVSRRRYEQAGGGVRALPEYGTIGARASHAFTWNEGQMSVELFVEGKNLADVYYETSPERAAPGRMLDAGVAVGF